MTDYTAKLALLLEMTPEERRVYLVHESVVSEQQWLNELLEGWRDSRIFTLTEVREQRRRVQVWQRRLNEAKARLAKKELSDKQSKLSTTSET